MTPDGLFRKIAEAALVECLAECEMNYRELLETVKQQIAEAVAAEREACAGIAEDELLAREAGVKDPLYAGDLAWQDGGRTAAYEIMRKIRARSEGEPGDR